MIIEGVDITNTNLRVLLDLHFLLVLDFERSRGNDEVGEIISNLLTLEDFIVNKFGDN